MASAGDIRVEKDAGYEDLLKMIEEDLGPNDVDEAELDCVDLRKHVSSCDEIEEDLRNFLEPGLTGY